MFNIEETFSYFQDTCKILSSGCFTEKTVSLKKKSKKVIKKKKTIKNNLSVEKAVLKAKGFNLKTKSLKRKLN